MTGKIPLMRLHEHFKAPINDMPFKMKGEEIMFILSLMTRVHSSLIETLKDPNASGDDKQAAYDFALHTERLYANLFKQLKLNKPSRLDLH